MPEKQRLYYLDSMRIAMTVLVVMHHSALAYGGEGLHPYKATDLDAISAPLFSLFAGVNQSFFMAAFFLLSAYFIPNSFDRKGAGPFLKDRLIRLGIPIIAYMLVLLQINQFLLLVVLKGEAFRPAIGWNVGHLWFLQALILFSFAYALFRLMGERTSSNIALPDRHNFWIIIGVLALLTFVVRLAYPVGATILGMQPGHFVHYIAAFAAGIIANRNGWLAALDDGAGRYWGRVALITIPGLILIGALAGTLSDPMRAKLLLGGPNIFAFAFAIWESIMMVAVIIWMLVYFRKHYNTSGPWAVWLAANAYAVYIIHQTVLIAVNVGLHPVAVSSSVKFLVAVAVTVPLCFWLSALIRRLPVVQRVLG